jgi:hypothetical protein
MSLEVYQEIFCKMVATPAFRERVLERSGEYLNGLDLTDRECRRLLAIAAQPGMRVNTAIHRANRITPVDHSVPFSLFLLGERLRDLLQRYWSENPTENLQIPAECDRFAAFLEGDIQAGRIVDPYLEEVLAFERACTELKFFTEEELRRTNPAADDLPRLVKIITFRHDPEPLLETLANGIMPAASISEGEFHLLIDCRTGEPDFRLIDAEALKAIFPGRDISKNASPQRPDQ